MPDERIENILKIIGLAGVEETTSDDPLIKKAEDFQSKIADALDQDEIFLQREKIASGLNDEEAMILKHADLNVD